ncbi:MAG: TadE/TadG family type IV pilus assembly protein, partial [Notoacmeibacter sp.]
MNNELTPAKPVLKTGFISKIRQKLGLFGRQEDGAAAVEFALVVPIMLTLYFGTMEISQGVEVNKKAGRASSLVGDLVTQQAVITKAEIVAIAAIAKATMQPYSRAEPTVEVVGIQVTDEALPKAKVVWSQRVKNGSGASFLTVGDVISIPNELLIRNTFLVRGGLEIPYYPITTYTIDLTVDGKKGIPM